MSEREAAAVSRPKCPKCGEPDAAQLHDGPKHHNWQCRNMKCLHEFQTTREVSVSAMVAEERRRRAMKVEEVAAMANGEFRCDGCGEDQGSKRSLGQHRRFCKGKESTPGVSRKRSSPAAAAAPTGGALIPIISEVPEDLVGTHYGETVSMLIRRREDLRKELSGVSDAITQVVNLAKMASAGAEPAFRKVD